LRDAHTTQHIFSGRVSVFFRLQFKWKLKQELEAVWNCRGKCVSKGKGNTGASVKVAKRLSLKKNREKGKGG
jgi:hypothetical protein